MKKFLAIYTGIPETMARWNDLPAAERNARMKRGIEAWHAWADKYQSAIVDHPHFSIFPGAAVEVMECMPVPGL